jgi:hypothetical protein
MTAHELAALAALLLAFVAFFALAIWRDFRKDRE